MPDVDTHRIIKALNQGFIDLSNRTATIDSHVADVARQQVQTRQELLDLRAIVQEFIRHDQLAKQLQLAETRVVQVRQELAHSFGHYSEVRRTSVGIIQALDAGIVREGTMQTASEELMLATPGYWLAPAVVAVAAWIRNQRELAEKALKEAVERNDAKAGLFFALLLRRYRRWEASANWMAFFFQRQDPLALPREFVVILEGVAYGAFGPAGKNIASQTIERWLESEKIGSVGAAEAVSRWKVGIRALAPPYRGGAYPLLAKHAGNWAALEDQLRRHQVHGAFAALLEAVFQGDLEVPARLEARIDSIIATLVSEFDPEELPLRRKEAELQAVIEFEGDVPASAASADERKRALDNRLSIGELLTNTGLRPKEAGASRAAQRLAMATSKEWVVQAHGEITAELRNGQVKQAALAIEGWSGTMTERRDLGALEHSLRAQIQAETRQLVEKVRLGVAEILAGAGSVFSFVFTFVGGFNAIFLVLAIGLAGWVGFRYSTLGKRRAAINSAGKQREEQAVRTLMGCDAEFTDYLEELILLDGQASKVTDLLMGVDKRQFELATGEGRSGLS